jgi:uncharacterized protein (DUF983 family)
MLEARYSPSLPLSAMTPLASERDLWPAIKGGFFGRCPRCRTGRLFATYLKISDQCPHCGLELHHHRADDAPPYFTIFVVGHLIVPWVWALETAYHPPGWVHAFLWLPLVVALSLLLLPAIKGAIVGMQWAMRMHGFALPSERRQDCTPSNEIAVDDRATRPQ